MNRCKLAEIVGNQCRDITGQAPIPAPFDNSDAVLATALLRVVNAFNTHGHQGLEPLALAYWHEWHDGMEGFSPDPQSFRDGAEEMERRIGKTLEHSLPAAWEGEDE